MSEKEIENIIAKYLTDQATIDEIKKLSEWLNSSGNLQIFKTYVKLNTSVEYIMKDFNTEEFKKETLIKIRKESQKEKRMLITSVFKYAALVLILIGITYVTLEKGTPASPTNPSIVIDDETITLQLENGEIEKINTSQNSRVIQTNGSVVAQQERDKLVYEGNSGSKSLSYNTLNVPYGKRMQLELSDGTIVYLNSGSSLKYPVEFIKGKNRLVYVKGEAYFKVTEDANHPFVVNVNEINVRVLGTEFNVSSYKEDGFINTVLVSGEVRLYDGYSDYDPDTSLKLEPDHMAVWNKSQRNLSVEEVNVETHTAWIKGKLVFRDMPFKEMTKKLERRYNVRIINKNYSLEENTFTAKFDIESIEEVLETLKINFGIEYKIINNEINIY